MFCLISFHYLYPLKSSGRLSTKSPGNLVGTIVLLLQNWNVSPVMLLENRDSDSFCRDPVGIKIDGVLETIRSCFAA